MATTPATTHHLISWRHFVIATVGVCAAGCSFGPTTPTLTSGKAPAPSAVNSDWSQIAQRWVNAYYSQATIPRVAPASGSVVTVNLTAIASRLPSWRLADSLEGRHESTIVVGTVPKPAIGELPAPPVTAMAPVPSFALGAEHVAADDLESLRKEAQQLQTRAINSFINAESRRQEASLDNRLAALRAALDADIDAAQRVTLPELSPSALAPEMQLEMTNLRLKIEILQDLPPQERNLPQNRDALVVARTRLIALEKQWAVLLRRQEQERLAELDRLRVEQPFNMMRQGTRRIENIKQDVQKADKAARAAVLDAQQDLVTRDFTSPRARELAIDLPSVALNRQELSRHYPPGLLNDGATATLGGPIPNIFEHRRPPDTSNTSNTVRHTSSVQIGAQRAAQITTLRALALKEAHAWAKVAAHRAGWKLAEEVSPEKRPAAAPDRTADVLRILHLA